jgi:ubiquinone/menaquinone biosynthesis C-methylase UbiE
MRKTAYQKLTEKERKLWQNKKKKEWNKNAAFWIKIIREKLDPYRLVVTNKAILESLKGKKGLRILDAGCGEGYLSRILAKKGHRVIGIDATPKLIEAAKDLEREKPLGIKYLIADFRKTNFPTSSFDVVLAHQTIHEIENPEKALREFARILKRKGKLICLFLHPCFEISGDNYKENNFASLYFSKVQVKKGKYLVSGIWSPSPYFYLHLPLSEWVSLFKKAGFLICDIKEPHPPLDLLKRDKWWREYFKKPLFILIEAMKS